MDEPLFPSYATHVVVRCWDCGREIELRPGDVPEMSKHQFERRAKCQSCGAGWPQVTAWPRPPSRWDQR